MHYYSKAYGIQFAHPDDWVVGESKELECLQIFPPRLNGATNGDYTDIISILVRRQDQNFSTEAPVLSYIANEVVKSNYSGYHNMVLMTLESKTLNNIRCREMFFAYEDEKRNVVMQALQLVFLYMNKVYLVTFTAKEGNFMKLLPQVQQTLGSIVVE